MNSKTNASNGNSVVESLTELALNLDWSWSHNADDLWRQLDPELWGLTHNPWMILQTVSRERLEVVTSAPQFQRTLDQVLETRIQREEAAKPHSIFQHGVHAERRVADLFRWARQCCR